MVHNFTRCFFISITSFGISLHPGALPITGVAYNSTVPVPVSLAFLNCVGNESSLLDCPTSNTFNEDMTREVMIRLGESGLYPSIVRSDPVGVRCEGKFPVVHVLQLVM